MLINTVVHFVLQSAWIPTEVFPNTVFSDLEIVFILAVIRVVLTHGVFLPSSEFSTKLLCSAITFQCSREIPWLTLTLEHESRLVLKAA